MGVMSDKHVPGDAEDARRKISTISGLSRNSVVEIEDGVRDFLIVCQSQLEQSNSNLKLGVAGRNGPVGRLTCIGAILKSYRPEAYVETGTQYGVSAEFAYQFVAQEKIDTKVISIDVKESDVTPLNSGYRSLLLESPYGPALSHRLAELRSEYSNIVFAHDSDHTFEHMHWELREVGRKLKPRAVICDDVHQHKAFKNFCKSSRQEPTFLRFGNEPAFGLVSFCDPDGT